MLWSGTFVVAIAAVVVYLAIRPAITRRVASASARIDTELPSEPALAAAPK